LGCRFFVKRALRSRVGRYGALQPTLTDLRTGASRPARKVMHAALLALLSTIKNKTPTGRGSL
jgi:hypothetical protein